MDSERAMRLRLHRTVQSNGAADAVDSASAAGFGEHCDDPSGRLHHRSGSDSANCYPFAGWSHLCGEMSQLLGLMNVAK